MAVYQAPDIKDRIAVGDDLYQIADSGGKKKLTPDPTEVTEAGTPINKALLQPMADAIQALSEIAVPYNNYWWRIRQNAGTYSLRLVPAANIDDAVESYTHNNGTRYYQVNFFSRSRSSDGDHPDQSRTYKVASSVTVSTAGAISLVNPTTYTSNADDSNINSVLTSRCSGKYVQGLAPDPTKIYKIASGASVEDTNFMWTVSGETTYQTDTGYKWSNVDSTVVQVVVADYSGTVSDFSYVSNENADFYPHSGTQNGVEYQYLGKIFEVAVKAEPYQIKKVSVTAASWNDKQYDIDIPHTRYLLFVGGRAAVLVNNGGAYGVTHYEINNDSTYTSTDQYSIVANANYLVCGSMARPTATVSTLDISVAASGLRLLTTLSTGPALTLSYLPL